MIDTRLIIVGDKVHYDPLRQVAGTISEKKKYENGIVKEIVSANYVRVVYNCGNDWDNFSNYTAARTSVRDLFYGWR